VRRVLSGFAGRELSARETDELAQRLVPPGRAADWNQALMDYGATVYKARPRRGSRPAQPFTTTNRFWRGRILDALREHSPLPLPHLLDALPYPTRDEQRIRGLVHALHEEGLVQYDAGDDQVALPT
jgi:adenine-specific DNA glycosylase